MMAQGAAQSIEDGAALAGRISGTGTTKLDYSAYTTAFTIDLRTGAATGTAGVSNISQVIGGSGSDTLIGADADAAWNVSGLGSGTVVFGATVDLVDEDTGEELTYRIVGQDEADIKAGLLSINSPIARALVGKREGDVVVVEIPAGSRSLEIVKVRYL